MKKIDSIKRNGDNLTVIDTKGNIHRIYDIGSLAGEFSRQEWLEDWMDCPFMSQLDQKDIDAVCDKLEWGSNINFFKEE